MTFIYYYNSVAEKRELENVIGNTAKKHFGYPEYNIFTNKDRVKIRIKNRCIFRDFRQPYSDFYSDVESKLSKKYKVDIC